MGLAVELYFDEVTEQSIRQLRQTLTDAGISSILDDLGDRPHISLAGLPGEDISTLLPIIEEFAQNVAPFTLKLSAIGLFPTSEGVLYLSPAPTETLLAIHRRFHQELAKTFIEVNPYYQPDVWVPHCTIATDLHASQLADAVKICLQTFKPIVVNCREIGLVKFRPATPIYKYLLHS